MKQITKTIIFIGIVIGMIFLCLFLIDKIVYNSFSCMRENSHLYIGDGKISNLQREGRAIRYLNVTDCTKDEDECILQNIVVQPTWKFSDGNEVYGKLNYTQLKEFTNC